MSNFKYFYWFWNGMVNEPNECTLCLINYWNCTDWRDREFPFRKRLLFALMQTSCANNSKLPNLWSHAVLSEEWINLVSENFVLLRDMGRCVEHLAEKYFESESTKNWPQYFPMTDSFNRQQMGERSKKLTLSEISAKTILAYIMAPWTE